MLKTAFLAHKDCPITLQQLKVVGQAKGIDPSNDEQTK